MSRRLFALFFCALPLEASALAFPVAEALPARQEKNYDGESFRNPVNALYLCAFSDVSGNPRSASYLQLREAPARRVIASLRGDWKSGFDALWSPDGKHVAFSAKEISTGAEQTLLLAVSSHSLEVMALPAGLRLEALLPKDDPAWKLRKVAASTRAVRWIDNGTLELAVRAVFRDFESGYTTVAYRIVTKWRGNAPLEIVSVEQTESTRDR